MIYGYIRVSSDRQTVENQRFEINKFAAVKKLKINGWIEETISGTKSTSSGGGSAAKPIEPDYVDWIQPLLDRLRKQTENLVEQSESLVEYTAQNAKLNQAIGSNAESINAIVDNVSH